MDDVEKALDALKKTLAEDSRSSHADFVREFYPTIRAALEAQQWQPIETAPDDGTSVLIASEIIPSEAAQQAGAKAFWDVAIGSCYSRSFKDKKWTSVLGGKPTHWMPLPKPPRII